MAYTRSIREIPLDEEPMKSAMEAVAPDPEESPYSGEIRWDNATEDQLRLLSLHPDAYVVLGGSPEADPAIGETPGEVG